MTKRFHTGARVIVAVKPGTDQGRNGRIGTVVDSSEYNSSYAVQLDGEENQGLLVYGENQLRAAPKGA